MGAPGLIGIENVMKNLNREIRKMKKASIKGLIEASIVIRRDMDLRDPKIPINLGNLRASWFTTTGAKITDPGGAFKGKDSGKMSGDHSKVIATASGKSKAVSFPVLIMGFSAGYSGVVHEAKQTKFKRPGSGPFFFKSAIKRNQRVVLEIIANEIRNRK